MRMILLGPPGAGKGTQAEAITKRLHIPAVSTGDILRDAVVRETPVGLKAKAFMDAGDLVPDEIIIGIVIERISRMDCNNGYILDGVPRTLIQAQALDEQGIDLDVVLSIEVSDDEILKRLGGRRVCPDCKATYHVISKPTEKDGICDSCGGSLATRKDDEQETIRNRLEAYHKETKPLKKYYEAQGILKAVDGHQLVAETTEAVFKIMGLFES